MPKAAREVVPGEPHHVTQRGNNRQPIFLDREDHLRYLGFLETSLQEHDIDLLGFCLMPNHIHHVLVPPNAESLASAMNQTSSGYARSFNRRYQRSGHLWQCRYYSCSMDSAHLYRALRYVEMNPVRAGLVQAAWQHEWSSAALHAGKTDLLTGLTVGLKDAGLDIHDWGGYLTEAQGDTDRVRIRSFTSRGVRWDR